MDQRLFPGSMPGALGSRSIYDSALASARSGLEHAHVELEKARDRRHYNKVKQWKERAEKLEKEIKALEKDGPPAPTSSEEHAALEGELAQLRTMLEYHLARVAEAKRAKDEAKERVHMSEAREFRTRIKAWTPKVLEAREAELERQREAELERRAARDARAEPPRASPVDLFMSEGESE